MQHLIYNTANEWLGRVRMLMSFTAFVTFTVWLGVSLLFWYSSSKQTRSNLKVFQLFFDGSVSLVIVTVFLIGAKFLSKSFDPQRRLFIHALKESRKVIFWQYFMFEILLCGNNSCCILFRC
jgi:hypothetical protein